METLLLLLHHMMSDFSTKEQKSKFFLERFTIDFFLFIFENRDVIDEYNLVQKLV